MPETCAECGSGKNDDVHRQPYFRGATTWHAFVSIVHWYPLGGVVTTACGLKAGAPGTTASVYAVTCDDCKQAVEDSFRGPKRPTDAPTEGQA